MRRDIRWNRAAIARAAAAMPMQAVGAACTATFHSALGVVGIVSLMAVLVVATAALPRQLSAQQRTDTTRMQPPSAQTPPATPASSPGVALQPPRRAAPIVQQRGRAPLTPRRAFLYSALLPGLGQSRLDRGSSGALFASVELAALVMLRRTAADVREARRYLTDTIPDGFLASSAGPEATITPSGTIVGPYTSDLVRARRLHAEDWIAVVAFNHLFSGADAFVSAQLWDMPVQFSATPTLQGPMLVVSVRF